MSRDLSELNSESISDVQCHDFDFWRRVRMCLMAWDKSGRKVIIWLHMPIKERKEVTSWGRG